MKTILANSENRYPLSLGSETIETLKAARRQVRHQRSRGRFAFYDYLEAVYSIYMAWKSERSATKNARTLAAALDIPMRQDVSALRILIEATWPGAETKQKSRWTRALGHAHDEGTAPRALISFIKANGGISGCAKSAARYDPKRRTNRDDWA